jgi:hypothetical protein
MNLKRLVAQGSIAGVLAVSAIGAAPAVSADPDWGDWNHDEWVDQDWHNQEWRFDNNWEWNNWNDHDWDKWWRTNKWRNDDPPPWGWGPPPPVHWRGHPTEWIDYWGFRVHPISDLCAFWSAHRSSMHINRS